MNWLNYRKELGVELNEAELEAFCINLILNYLGELQSPFFSRKEINTEYMMNTKDLSFKEYGTFCETTGTRHFSGKSFSPLSNVMDILTKNSDSLSKFLSYYVAMINCLSEEENKNSIKKDELLTILDKAFAKIGLEYEKKEDGNKIFIFPKNTILKNK